MKYLRGFSNASIFLLLLGLNPVGYAQTSVCGSLNTGYGPYDFYTDKDKLGVVEGRHFPPKVEHLRGGSTSTTPGGDIAYTLRSFPNHPRALMAMMRLAERDKTDRPRDSTYTVECWLERAERFRPEDQMAKALHGIYLASKGKKKEALEKLDAALALGVPSPNTDYNVGLAYFDLGEFDKALVSAHRAYDGGFPLPGLKNKMKRAGKWKDPVPVVPDTSIAKDNNIQDAGEADPK
jgi:tetratricopeptide (TPR) repeat protein